jgi:hypothetical protein
VWRETEFENTEDFINIKGKMFVAANIYGDQHGAVSLFQLRKGTRNIMLNPLQYDTCNKYTKIQFLPHRIEVSPTQRSNG